MNVAYTYFLDMDEEQPLSFSFRGMRKNVLYELFHFLCPDNGKGVARDYKFRIEHDPKYIHCHGYWRLGVDIIDFNKRFCSLQDFCLLIESHFKAIAPEGSRITFFPEHEFLNIKGTDYSENVPGKLKINNETNN